jgi:hypothetical protein
MTLQPSQGIAKHHPRFCNSLKQLPSNIHGFATISRNSQAPSTVLQDSQETQKHQHQTQQPNHHVTGTCLVGPKAMHPIISLLIAK